MIYTDIDLFPSPATRIVSLVPSITELLSDLGLEEETIGITKFCIRPEAWFRSKKRVGGTKSLDLDTILSMNPDLVIANREENVKEQVEELAEKLPVYLTDINNLDDALEMISAIGQLTGRHKRGKELHDIIGERFSSLEPAKPLNAVYLIWKDPLMTIGGDTFISQMMSLAGFQNLYAVSRRYPAIELRDIKNLSPEILLLSSEPYPFAEKHAEYFRDQLPDTKVRIVDGEMFSWYGSRLIEAPGYFRSLREIR